MDRCMTRNHEVDSFLLRSQSDIGIQKKISRRKDWHEMFGHAMMSTFWMFDTQLPGKIIMRVGLITRRRHNYMHAEGKHKLWVLVQKKVMTRWHREAKWTTLYSCGENVEEPVPSSTWRQSSFLKKLFFKNQSKDCTISAGLARQKLMWKTNSTFPATVINLFKTIGQATMTRIRLWKRDSERRHRADWKGIWNESVFWDCRISHTQFN